MALAAGVLKHGRAGNQPGGRNCNRPYRSRSAQGESVSIDTRTVRGGDREHGGSGVRGSGVRDQGSGIRGQGSGVRDQGSGIRGQGSGVRDQGEKPAGRRRVFRFASGKRISNSFLADFRFPYTKKRRWRAPCRATAADPAPSCWRGASRRRLPTAGVIICRCPLLTLLHTLIFWLPAQPEPFCCYCC